MTGEGVSGDPDEEKLSAPTNRDGRDKPGHDGEGDTAVIPGGPQDREGDPPACSAQEWIPSPACEPQAVTAGRRLDRER
jgi:hypothetical protein